jgi:hypothetical protein
VALTGSFGGTVPLSPIAADGDNMSFATRPMSADGSSVMSTMSTKSALSSTQAAGRIQGSVFARREHEAGSSSALPSKLGAIDWNPSTKVSLVSARLSQPRALIDVMMPLCAVSLLRSRTVFRRAGLLDQLGGDERGATRR